ncbi:MULTISPECIES: aldehyde dehydrogenase [Marinobacter]|uniref:Aldehyde dehydrogenase n=1 Tax=Marinobacter suaedae TaxID=3057675 RepID=A0ABT8VXY3_9GAMM|nr:MULTISPECIES: aldehyde dehydrogenase [unclassified Marinobacter]MBZ2168973.1 aldehyde dehydrogenase [Marinobacter sp. F4216]MDO3720859.1 aldehyde dehydrogenase [Marinobacter sp. chi1]
MAEKHTFEHWQSLAASLEPEGRAYINGHYVDALGGETFDTVSPIDNRVLAKVASCQEADVNVAVEAARDAFNRGVWSELAPAKRKSVLLKWADLIAANADELALLETLDMGKPIGDSRAVDVNATVRALRWTAEAIDKLYDEIAPTPHDQLGMITREAVGVVAAIVPWNFPMIMATWKFAPALAMGNSFILKPSEKSPLTALRLAQLATEAGIPDGVFNVLPGFGHTAGKALALHMDVDTLAFTGSTAIAKQLMIYAGESNMKRVWTEAGGKSANIVFADADLDAAAAGAAGGICFNAGEVCTAGSRLLVEESVADEFMEKVRALVAKWRPGHPLDPNTNVGAIVDNAQMERVLSFIQIGQKEGAKMTVGGQQVMPVEGGLFVEPTVFENVNNDMTIAREEIFGPVLSVIRFKDEDEALQIANDSIYGLAAGLWTNNLSRAHRVARKLRAGSVWVNEYDLGDMTAPFGGYKQSGNGRDKSLHAFEKYSEVKATWFKL